MTAGAPAGRVRPAAALARALPGLALAWAIGVALPALAARLTLGLADLPHDASLLIADEQAYSAAEGLDLRVEHGVNGNRCLMRLTDGAIQLSPRWPTSRS